MANWKLIDKPKTMQATKSLIVEFHDMAMLQGFRPLKERRLLVYQRILEKGEFRPVTWASCYCEETKETYKVNGQHTCELLFGRIENIPEFFITVERYDCKYTSDVSALYSTFDSSQASRTAREINCSFASAIRELDNVPKKIIHLAVSASAYQEWAEDTWNHTAQDRAELLLDNVDYTLWLDKILNPVDIDKKLSKPLFRGPISWAMLGTFKKTKGGAEEFWSLVRDETHVDRNNPTRVLAHFLGRIAVPGGQKTATKKEIVANREIYVKCIHAWNAWRKNERTELKFYVNKKTPAFV